MKITQLCFYRTFKRSAFVATILITPHLSYAGGLYMYEMGTSDLGFANAGSSARAEDSSTLYSNPAGMTRLKGDQITVSAQALYGNLKYEQDGAGVLNGSNPENAIGWLPGGSAFYTHSVDDNLKVGLGLYNNFGLALDFGDSWAGNNIVSNATLTAFTLQPTIAYRINNQWSFGGGITANYGYFELERVTITNETKKLDDGDWSYGVRLGILYEPAVSTRFGLSWGSEVEYDYNVEGSVTIGATTLTIPLSANITAPQQLMFSAYHRVSDKWAVMGNLGWQDWSEFSDMTLEVNGVTTVSKIELEDTWHAAIGAQYTLNEKIKLNGGIAFDTSMYKDQSKTSFSLPSGDSWRFATGMEYEVSIQSSLGVAAEYLKSEDASDSNALVSGSYDNVYMVFLGVNYTYRF